MRLVDLPDYSPDYIPNEAIVGGGRGNHGNLSMRTKAWVRGKVSHFLAGLSGRKDEVKRHCRTVLHSRTEGLSPDSHGSYRRAANAHPALALVQVADTEPEDAFDVLHSGPTLLPRRVRGGGHMDRGGGRFAVFGSCMWHFHAGGYSGNRTGHRRYPPFSGVHSPVHDPQDVYALLVEVNPRSRE